MDKEYCPYCMNPIIPGKPCSSCGLTEGTYAPSPHHLPPGTVLAGRYLVGRVLGEGGFGITYIGCDLRLELRVAIKEYYPHDRVNRNNKASLTVTGYTGNVGKGFDAGRERFIQEARVMARMDKTPQIVAVRDFFQENNTAYIVMEYVDGTTFKELVAQKGGKISASELLPLVEPLFSALSAMHALGLIHRDISPDNLMLENGGVRLLDFGCARESAQGVNTMTIVLKHGYSPIEQYQHKGQGPWTDVYSLSATLYYCLTGKTPPQALDRICGEELTPPRQLGADLTPAQEKAILRGMGMRRSQRFPSVEELHAALYKGVDASAEGLEDETPDQPPPPEAVEGPIREETARQPERAPVTAPAVEPEPEPAPAFERSPAPEPEPAPERSPEDQAEPAAADQAKRPSILDFVKARWPVAAGAGAALVLLIALLVWHPWAGNPSTVDDPGPTQTMEPSNAGGASAQPTQTVSADPGVDYLAQVMETVEWLRLDDVEVDEAELRARLDALPIDELFAGAVHVDTIDELDSALGEGKPIVIDADMDFSRSTFGNRNNREPVLIREGVTVTAAWDYTGSFENDETGESFWTVDGSILINRGTIRGRVVMGDWDNNAEMDTNLLINYGTMYSNLRGGEDESGNYASSNVVVNLGTLGIPQSQFRQASLYNLGTLLHGHIAPEGETPLITTQQGGDYYIDLIGCYFYNSGEIVMEGQSSEKPSRMDVADGTRFANTGSIRLGNYGEVNNHATLLNFGEIAVTERTGAVNNLGWLLNTGADCALDTAHCYNVGLVQAGPEASVDLYRVNRDGGGAALPFSWEMDGLYRVYTKEEFYAALDDRDCAWIMLDDGTALTLTEDLILTKGLAIPDVSSLTMDGCSLTVAGENGYLVVDGPVDLRGGVFTVRDEAVASVSELRDCGGITIRNNGYLMLRAPLRPNDGAAIDIRDARYLCCIGPLELHRAQVNLERGLLRGTGGVGLYGCTVDVGEYGEFLTDGCGVYFDPDTVITNHGGVDLNGWDTQELACRLTNYGELGANEQMTISGSLVNHGHFRIWANEGRLLRVSGSLENHGTVEFKNGSQDVSARFQPWAAGTVTGVPEQYVAN